MRYTISSDGRIVTVSNEKLRRGIQVDVVQRCGMHGVGDLGTYGVEFTDYELHVIYAKRCVVKVPVDATGSSCEGCD